MNPTTKDDLLKLADELENSAGLYRKDSGGKLVEIHLRRVLLIQAALRAYAKRDLDNEPT